MARFYKYDKKNKIDCKIQIKNVQMIDFNEDKYDVERKPQKLKYFKEPKLTAYPLNLNEGYEKHRFRKMDSIYGNTLSKVIKFDIEENLSSCNERDSFNVFTHRTALLNIMKSHFNGRYSPYFDWKLFATKFGNNLYIHSDNDDNFMGTEDNKKRSYHYKLEQILFSDSPHKEPVTDEPVDENIRLNGTYRCQLGNFKLIYSAEVQGVCSNEEIKDLNNLDLLNKCRFVNTKITFAKKHRSEWIDFQKYFQNYLTNVDVTYYALRDNEGYVHEPIQPCKTADMCKQKSWNPKEYEQFLYDFLSLIAEKMSGVNSLETTYEFIYSSKNKAVNYIIHEGRTDKTFLPETYIKIMMKKNQFEN